jgi:hypothetical protein
MYLLWYGFIKYQKLLPILLKYLNIINLRNLKI